MSKVLVKISPDLTNIEVISQRGKEYEVANKDDVLRMLLSIRTLVMEVRPVVPAPAPTTPANADKPEKPVLGTCTTCKTGVTSQKVVDWCNKNYNGTLYCMKCQPKTNTNSTTPPPAETEYQCSKCSTGITSGTKDFSSRNFGMVLCKECQAPEIEKLQGEGKACVGCGKVLTQKELSFIKDKPNLTGGNRCYACQGEWRKANGTPTTDKPKSDKPKAGNKPAEAPKGRKVPCCECGVEVAVAREGVDPTKVVCADCAAALGEF